MKLVNKGSYEINLFRDGIKVDRNLLKFRNLEKALDTVKINSNDKINEKGVSLEFKVITDPDEITPDEYVFLKEDEKNNVLSSLSRLKNIKDFLRQNDSSLFNLRISKYLLDLIKTNRFAALSDSNNNIVFRNSIQIVGGDDESKKKKSIFKKIESFFRRKIDEISRNRSNEEFILDVLDLFDQVKFISNNNEKEFIDRTSSYMALIKKADILHQEAQKEKLLIELVNHIYESVISVSGFNHYITFDDLVKLQKKCSKQLDLDYIKNFTRVIPDEVVSKKIIADSLQVFDNYVVLHYDPEGKAFSWTEEEKERAKDPVLFGVISGSDKLYYIGSWIDDYCDLTWDKIVEKIGEDKTLFEENK